MFLKQMEKIENLFEDSILPTDKIDRSHHQIFE